MTSRIFELGQTRPGYAVPLPHQNAKRCQVCGLAQAMSEGLQPLQLQGSVQLNGRELAHLPTHQRGVGLVFQDAFLFPHMTVAENLLFAVAFLALMIRMLVRRSV